MTTAALYLRQSLDATGEGLAIARQEKECRALCDRLGLEVGQVYVDNDTSATSGKARPGFEALLAARPQAIVAWHQDRLLRLTRDLEPVIALDVPVYTVSAGELDLATPAGRAVARTVAAWSQYETEQKAERQKAAHRQRAAAGKPWTTRRPFGFELDGMTHDDDEAELIRRMYADLLAGVPQAAIVRGLNDRGIPTTLGNAWRQSALRALLMNPRNAGLRSHNGVIVGQAAWEPIVSEATWRAAVGIMTTATRKGAGKRTNLMSGLARCGVCGVTVRAKRSIHGQRIYACPNGGHVGRDARAVDDLVRDLVVGRLSQPDALDLLATDSVDVRELQAEADAARQALEVLAETFAVGGMPASAFRAGTEKAQARLVEVEAAMAQAAAGSPLLDLVQSVDAAAAWDGLTLARQRGIVDALMTVTIDRTSRGSKFRPESIGIEWKAPQTNPRATA